jgi:hypothetical protein
MNNDSSENTSPDAEPVAQQEPHNSLFISFYWKGRDNGIPKEGFDSRVISIPVDVTLGSAADLKTVADAIATSEFSGGKRYADLEISILGFNRLPI